MASWPFVLDRKTVVRWPKLFSPCNSQTLQAARRLKQLNRFDQLVMLLQLKVDSSFTGPLFLRAISRAFQGSLSLLAPVPNAIA